MRPEVEEVGKVHGVGEDWRKRRSERKREVLNGEVFVAVSV